MATIQNVLIEADRDEDHALERLKELLRIPSVGTDPAHDADTHHAAAWLRNDLASMGFQADIRQTAGQPVVLARHHKAGASQPTILFYGHYDVQPADPLELWDSPPFEPVIKQGPRGRIIVARGAVDDKGQLMMFLEACRAWINTDGTLPVNVTIMLEGEEECGSPNLDAFISEHKDLLKADIAVICDTRMWEVDHPAITTSLRGMAYHEVILKGPNADVHSGIFGGAVPNPINVLCRLIGEMHDEDHRVTLPGFYDGVFPVSNERKAGFDSLNSDEMALLQSVGITAPYGEKEYSFLEKTWTRPTLDANGIIGGYAGEGSKTIIASEARAKISCRLVGKQNPDAIIASLEQFIIDRLPDGMTASFIDHGRAPALEVDENSEWLQSARRALSQIYEKPAVNIGSGGSIPVAESLQRLLDLETLLIGFGLDDDRVHSPNEKFDLACFFGGLRSMIALIAEFRRESEVA